VRGLAYTHRVSELVGRCEPRISAARAVVEAAAIDRTGTIAVRARDVRGLAGVDTRAAERALGEALVDRGFAVDLDDPDHELRALFSAGTCAVGWLAAESRRGFGARAPTEKPFFQPGSMGPLLARALANLAGARDGRRLLDPMCGTGGVLVEAGLVGADVVGVDAQAKMARGATENLSEHLDGGWTTLQGDATRLPLADDAVDGVVFDAPYGRQSKIAGEDGASGDAELPVLVEGALAEAHRITAGARAVVVGDRSWTDAARAAGWTVEKEFERRVHRSLSRHVLVLGG
jgi:tRNA (guanine10-N2)-dimethyltransferase